MPAKLRLGLPTDRDQVMSGHEIALRALTRALSEIAEIEPLSASSGAWSKMWPQADGSDDER